MNVPLAALCVLVILAVLLEAFEGVVLPRRISRPLRLTKYYYLFLWSAWRMVAKALPRRTRDDFFAAYGPLSLMLIFVTWANLLVAAFAILNVALGTPLGLPAGEEPSTGTYYYLSATTFITLGFGDIAPRGVMGRTLADIEAGVGFGFLAIVIGYLPVFYGAFARREIEIGLLDARASTPPTAGELLRRVGDRSDLGGMQGLLERWERWSAEILESHLSYPLLLYWRSQHDRQSWVATLATVLDTSATLIALVPCAPDWQARLTFAMARHAAVDLRLSLSLRPRPSENRLTPEGEDALIALLSGAGVPVKDTPETRSGLRELRALYEPHLLALADWLNLPLPGFLPDPSAADCWRTSSDPEDHFFQPSAR